MTTLDKEYEYFSEFGNFNSEKLQEATNQEDCNSECDCGAEPHLDHCQEMITERLNKITELQNSILECPTITWEV